MQSVIILGSQEDTRKKAEEIILHNNISKFDTEIFKSEKTVGIPDIRGIQKKLFLKPGYSDTKIVILEGFNGITLDAQNAFLKVLEEPPQNTILLILVQSLDFLLPTVLSRCNLINIKSEIKTLVMKEESQKILDSILNNSFNPLKLAQEFSKDKETTLKFLQNLIILSENELYTKPIYSKLIGKIQKTYTLIKTSNVNIRFALENLFLNI